MIVVEGPDGAGKTTLVTKLAEDFGFEVGTRGTKDRDLLWTVTVTDTMRALACAVQGNRDARIWDRLFFSEFVYAPITSRKVQFSHAQAQFVLSVMQSLQCPIIWAMPPEREVIANIESERHQMPGVRERAGQLYHDYQTVMMMAGQYHLNSILYDYTDPRAYEKVKAHLDSYLNRRKEREAR